MPLREKRQWVATCDVCGREEITQKYRSGPEVPYGWLTVEWQRSILAPEIKLIYCSIACLRTWVGHER